MGRSAVWLLTTWLASAPGSGPPAGTGPARFRVQVAPQEIVRLVVTDPAGRVVKARGRFADEAAAPGRWKVQARADGYPDFQREWTVAPGQAVAADITLPRGVRCPDGMTWIPAATFVMGAPEDDSTDVPRHDVTLGAYCIDRTEVTVQAWQACVSAHGCGPALPDVNWRGVNAGDRAKWNKYCNVGRPGFEKHPVNCINWTQAMSYCASRGGRLPTEAEWEYAARGDDGRRYPWGNEPPGPKLLNACGTECEAMGKADAMNWRAMYPDDDGWPSSAPVGSFPAGASPFGVLDLAGNAMEWTANWYAPYTADAVKNPTGPSTGEKIADRGGSWNYADPGIVRADYRDWLVPTNRSALVGFRCVRPTP